MNLGKSLTSSESESHSVVSNFLWPHGLYSPWNSPDQNTGVGSLYLLQRIFSTQGLNPGLPHYRRVLYQLSPKRNLAGSSPWGHKESDRTERLSLSLHVNLCPFPWWATFSPVPKSVKVATTASMMGMVLHSSQLQCLPWPFRGPKGVHEDHPDFPEGNQSPERWSKFPEVTQPASVLCLLMLSLLHPYCLVTEKFQKSHRSRKRQVTPLCENSSCQGAGVNWFSEFQCEKRPKARGSPLYRTLSTSQ